MSLEILEMLSQELLLSLIRRTWSISINEWNSLIINTSSLTTDASPLSGYTFDIDNNGSIDFTNTSGVLTLTWSQLQSFWITWNNATLLPTDVYTIKLTATDASNNIGTGILQVKVYNISPIVSIIQPILSGKTYSGSLALDRTITDPADQDFPMNTDIYYSSNGMTYTPIVTTTSNRTWSLSWNTATVPDWINYTVRVRAIDDYGNNTVTSLPFKIDNTWPVISGQTSYTIAEGANVTFSLTGTTDAIAGVSGFVWNINGSTTGTSTGLLSLTRSQLQSSGINNDGTYTIGVQAIDTIGNMSTRNITLIVTNTAPSLSLSSPSTGIYSGALTITRTASDPASADLPLNIIISYNNGINSWIIAQWTGLSNPYNRNVASIPDGTWYSITLVASDDDTSTTVSGNIFSIDHTPPIIRGFSGTYIINEWSGLVIDITTSTDAIAGLSGWATNFTGSINGITLPTSTNGYRNLSRLQLASYGIINGSGQSYPLNIQLTDAIGNRISTGGTLTVLNVKPTITITTPTTSPNIIGTIPIQRTVSDPVDTPLQIDIYYGQNVAWPWTLLSSWVSSTLTGLSRNTTLVNDGVYYIKATATDDKDTSISTQWPITINNIPDYVGWGGGSSISKDYCPNWDFTASFYDNACGSQSSTETWTMQTGVKNNTIQFNTNDIFNEKIVDWLCFNRNNSLSIINSSTVITNDEFKKALTFLYTYKMTSFNSIDDFKPYSNLTREQAAKIFSNFATNVLCRKPDTSLQTSYTDISNADITLKPYITKAYQLGLMKWGASNNFRPFDAITKAEFNAVLVRMILQSYLNEEWEVWYSKYNEVATQLWIIKKWATSVPVNRNDATLMMFRAYKNQDYSLQNINYESYILENRNEFIK